ncbi:uncharacterized protein DUF3667 [Jejuia pallidilutea]|uniref:Uncharacterized protein DUF3667 n=1 Tax=Jejuia pallidilutea TaxID=504487 RepID=A0A362XA11_9FLAO|nr:uncharacterized protein DUF3667 [Jejuia pallidilutea]
MNCKNCNTKLVSDSAFCHKCGAKSIEKRLTLKNLIQHLGETFFNYDNKLLKTIVCLCKAPEEVIDSYVKGVRKRYINPISFFGISLTLTGFSIFIIKKFYKNALDASQLFDTSTMYSNKVSEDIMASSADFSLEYSSLIYASMIPLFALISWILFLNKRYNFTEHLVSYMYSMSLYSITSVTLGLIVLVIAPSYYLKFGMWLYLVVLLYHCFLLNRLFKLSAGELILKTFLFLVILLFVFGGISIIAGIIWAIIMHLNGDLEPIIEAQKAAKGG